MGLVQGIQRMTQGDVAGGLIHTFTGSIGSGIYDMARGTKTGGQFAADIGTDAASAAISFIPGVGPAAAAALKAGMSAGSTVAQGGTAKEALLSGVSGAAGSLLGAKIGAKAPGKTELNIPNTTQTGVKGTLPGNTIKYQSHGLPVTEVGKFTKAQMIGSKINNQLKAKASTLKTTIGKAAGQGAVQGALSVGSAIMGAKQANAANEVSKQSLLFQKQTYNEQRAEIEKNKEQRRADALTDYNAASLFGSQLYGSDSNNTLLTSYHNPNANTGSFSILNYRTQNTQTDLT